MRDNGKYVCKAKLVVRRVEICHRMVGKHLEVDEFIEREM